MMSRQVAAFVARLREPYTLLCLLMMLGIVNLWRQRRESRGRLLLLTIPFGLLMVLSNPWVGYLSFGSLEWQYPPLVHRPANAEAIVVLGGGILPHGAVRTRAELNQDSLYRCLHAADVYRQGRPCPVLVSGGKTEPDAPTLARAMRAMLEELGVSSSDIIEEGDSLNTYENAVKCSELLRRRKVRRVILVTEALHMPRALRAFRGLGVEVIPSGCNYRATGYGFTPDDLLPDLRSVVRCQDAFHEWAGATWYWLRGRIYWESGK